MLESLSYYEIIASYPNCEPISTETLGTAFREKDYTVDMAIYWLSRIPFAADFSFDELHEYCSDIANKLCSIFDIEEKYKSIVLYGIFPKNYEPPTEKELNILFQELDGIKDVKVDIKSPLWPIKQMVMYYLIGMYSKNIYRYYKVKPLLEQLKDGREQYEKWIAEVASNF